MKSVCAWCNADLGEIKEVHETFGITHGICEKCVKILFSQNSKSLHEFLDSLDVPIIMFESEDKFRTGNKYARELLGKELSEIDDHGLRDIIECPYSETPGGCGSNVHCKSCVIRNTVMETFATGKSFTNVPAYPDIDTLSKIKSMCFRISTEKVGDFVLLRIDE
jgi:PAS domain-containing protein